MRSGLQVRAGRGDKVFTGAYVVPGVPGKNKVDSVMDLVERIAERDLLRSTMRDTWRALLEFDGLGSFLAGQIVADVAHLAAGVQWPDRASWAPVGPGSARGMNRLRGRPKDLALHQGQFESELPQLIDALRPMITIVWEDRQLQAMDIQNCLCEFDKTRRLQLGEGKVRARYDGIGTSQQAFAL